jgi:phospholipid/cholesterol/gamma-HCH transport system substrate-binding protein
VLKDAGPAADELMLLVKDLRKSLPKLLDPLIGVTEVLDARLDALEQLLVAFPRLVAAGPSALTEGDQKFGRVHLNLNQSPAPCTAGYLPPGQWRPTMVTESGVSPPLSSKHSFEPYYPAQCNEAPPKNVRGMNKAPKPNENWEQDFYGGNE